MKASESVVFANGEVGPLTTAGTFRYEVEKAENDQYGNMVTTVKCHGKVTSETAWELREAVKPVHGELLNCAKNRVFLRF